VDVPVTIHRYTINLITTRTYVVKKRNTINYGL